MNLPRWSLRYPVTAGMVLVAVLLVGAMSAVKLPLAFLPEVDFPGLEISIPYPNSLPAQVEEEITRPAEEALATLSRVRRIQSWSSPGGANIFVEFDWGEEIGPLRAEAREKLDRIRDQLPADVDRIQVNSFRSSDIPILDCRISAGRDLSRDYELLDRQVADPLRRVPGVAKVELYGVESPEVQIDFRADALRRHGLSAEEVVGRLEAASRSVAAGQLHRGRESRPLRVVNAFASVEEYRRFPLDGRGLRLGDVADVALEEPDLDYGRHLDRARAIGLNVMKESGANSVKVAERCRKVLEGMRDDPELRGVQVLTFTDQAEDIRNSIEGLLHAGLAGALLATGVLFLFLRRLAATLLVTMAIPVSVLAACGVLYFTGGTLNILTMMGLMLAVGMLVDNAVVVLESIERWRKDGLRPLRAALRGAREVLPAVVSSTVTSVIVFLPLVLGGRTEVTTWIGEVGRTIIFTLACSLFLSLTAIPLAAGRWLAPRPARSAGWIEWLSERHQRVLTWTLAHRPAALGLAFLVVVTAVFPFIPVDKSAFTGTKVEAVQIQYRFSDNLNHREVERYVTAVEDWIGARKDSLHVKYTYSYFTHNEAITRAYLARGWADDEGAQKVRKALRAGLPSLPGARLELRGQNEESGPATLAVRVFGDPGPRLDELAEEVRRRLAGVSGLTDLTVGREHGREEMEVVVDRDRAALYGLPTAQVAGSVARLFRGQPLARFRGPDGEVQVRARLAPEDRASREQLQETPLRAADGTVVPLAVVADFRTVRTPAAVERNQRRSVATVRGNVASSEAGGVRTEAGRALESLNFPPGYSWSFGAGFEEESRTQQEMLVNVLMALVLVYLVMAALFESLVHPFAIMFALPFAFVGIAWMCFLSRSPFNLMAQIGLLILIGIVVNNGIVLLHHVHQMRERRMERTRALLLAGRHRLRPILMTMTTTVLGLVPLAVGGSYVGNVLYFPLARTVIGGLVAATLLTLVLVPCLYTVIEDAAALAGRVWRWGPRRA